MSDDQDTTAPAVKTEAEIREDIIALLRPLVGQLSAEAKEEAKRICAEYLEGLGRRTRLIDDAEVQFDEATGVVRVKFTDWVWRPLL